MLSKWKKKKARKKTLGGRMEPGSADEQKPIKNSRDEKIFKNISTFNAAAVIHFVYRNGQKS
jgi:hypothetical protein